MSPEIFWPVLVIVVSLGYILGVGIAVVAIWLSKKYIAQRRGK